MLPAPEVVPATSDEQLGHVRGLLAEYATVLRAHHGEDNCREFEAELATLPGDYAPPEGCLLLALAETRPAGCVALRKIAEGVCEMKRLYALPAFRGRGVGRALATAVIAEAQRVGYRRMCLDTLPAMTAALALYRSLGFVATAPYTHRSPPGALYLERVLTPG
jgi:ribosomal protein S18 acetylase RimI-like enzyme